MDKTIFPAWERAFPRRKALFEAWDRQITEMAGLGTAFPCVPTHFNVWPQRQKLESCPSRPCAETVIQSFWHGTRVWRTERNLHLQAGFFL